MTTTPTSGRPAHQPNDTTSRPGKYNRRAQSNSVGHAAKTQQTPGASGLRLIRTIAATTDAEADTPPHDAESRSSALSVWATAQAIPAAQRKHRYTPESTAHPAKMLPAIAAHAITHYTRPGDLVLDPMCGIGTTLVEAVHAGRRAVGIEYEPHWAQIAQANLQLARDNAIDHNAEVVCGDARHLDALLPSTYLGQAALVVTSPPYGPSTHGRVSTRPGKGIHKYHHHYGNALDRGNLANIGHHRLLTGFTQILAGLIPYLRPGGHIVITIRPWREHAELIDLPAQILACGIHAGLTPVERCVALLARVAEHDLIPRGSFFQRDFIRKQRDNGQPLHLIAHEDVLVFQAGTFPRNSRELRGSQRELKGRRRCLSTVDGGVDTEVAGLAS